jgi:hypothetical protein
MARMALSFWASKRVSLTRFDAQKESAFYANE